MNDPSFIKSGDKRGTENTDEAPKVWRGPSAEVMIELAMLQPGAKRRVIGVKFACSACQAEGHDKSKDNACVFLDGRFSCAHTPGPTHRAMIAAQLNIPIVAQQRLPVVQGDFGTRPPLDGPVAERRPL